MAAAAKMTRHVQLLAALVVMELVNPLIADVKVWARIASIAVFCLVGVAVFRALFDTQRQRWIGGTLVVAAIVTSVAHVFIPQEFQRLMEALSSVMACAFFVFVLSVIVGHVFGTRKLHSDDVVGAFSGYMVIALVWGRLFVLAYMLAPGSFSISPDITWQLGNWHTLHALFDYYSFTTISSIGYADITTTGPMSNTLVWLEVMCGQFYLAVVVATIVGLKLAQALSPPSDGS